MGPVRSWFDVRELEDEFRSELSGGGAPLESGVKAREALLTQGLGAYPPTLQCDTRVLCT